MKRPCGARQTMSRCRMLAFKMMDDPYGSLTFAADLFRQGDQGLFGPEFTVKDKTRARWPHADDALQRAARRYQRSLCRRHHRSGSRLEGSDHWRHDLRHGQAGHSGAHGVPGSGYRQSRSSRNTKADQEKMGIAGCSAWPTKIRLSASSLTRRIRSDHHCRAWANCTSTSRSTV